MNDQNTLISFKETVCCCDYPGFSTIEKAVDKYILLKCNHCDLIRLDKVYSRAENFYSDLIEKPGLEYWGLPEYFKKYSSVFNYFFEERFKRIEKYLLKKSDDTWLDIGSGYGLWLDFLNQKSIKSFGIEIEENSFKYSVGKNLNVKKCSIEDFETEEKYLVITICDVLEHVENPKAILKKCYDLLLPGGVIYVQVPDVLGVKYPFKDSLGLPHHLWQFNLRTLRNLLEECGFKCAKDWTGIQGVIKYYEKENPGFFKKLIWNLVMKVKRGNRLQILALKNVNSK